MLDHMTKVCLVLYETSKLSSKVAEWLYHFALVLTMSKISLCFVSSPAFGGGVCFLRCTT
jgi:hypothetical protein